jgi:murein DD-endopeptidase MepM/ murein hydrolase activator NlpD
MLSFEDHGFAGRVGAAPDQEALVPLRREAHRVRRIRGPETLAEFAAIGGAGATVLLAAFVLLQAWSRPSQPPAAPGRVSPGDLSAGRLRFPVPAVSLAAMVDSFAEARGTRAHQAVDILAPRGSPVVAVDDGTLVRLSSSLAGGIAVYQLDVSGQLCFFYAHLERYARGLATGQVVKKGEVIGYVGTTGNAPRNTPHLHFAIHEVTSATSCWGGRPIDPYPLWR